MSAFVNSATEPEYKPARFPGFPCSVFFKKRKEKIILFFELKKLETFAFVLAFRSENKQSTITRREREEESER